MKIAVRFCKDSKIKIGCDIFHNNKMIGTVKEFDPETFDGSIIVNKESKKIFKNGETVMMSSKTAGISRQDVLWFEQKLMK